MFKKTEQVLTFLSLLSFVACVTVNIYFPVAKVERAAEDIVEDVYGTDPKQETKDEQSSLETFLALITPQAAHAQVSKADIDQKSNSAIRDQLYAEVAASLNIPGSEIEKVKAIFAQEWQGRAPSGWFIQIANGKWQWK